LPLEETELVRFRKARARRPPTHGKRNGTAGRPPQRKTRTISDLVAQAPGCYARYLNPVLWGIGGESEFVKTFVRGEGSYLWDAQGHRYLDLVAGFGSVNLGHNHPAVVEAVAQALRESAPGFAQSAINPYAAALAEALVTLAPPPLEMVFFANSGTEAVEAALKLSRLSTGRTGLLHCERSFHGKTLGALSVNGNPAYQRPFAPLLADCRSVVYGDIEGLERALSTRIFAAFLVEPIQGEGGMIVPPDDYLREAQRLCRRFGTLLVVDEIQTGLGRTGNLFAAEAEQIEPDIMTLAKSLGGGLIPIGAMLCRRDLWRKAYGTLQTFCLHTSTFGGGSLACAAGLATLEVLRAERLMENAAARGREIVAGLQKLCAKHDTLLEVRGRGLMLGLECQPAPASVIAYWRGAGDPQGRYLVPDIDDMVENSPMIRLLQTLLNEYRIYAQTTRSSPRVLRIQPPLTISTDDVSLLLQAIDESFSVLTFTNHLAEGLISKSILGKHQGNGHHSGLPVPGASDQP
jgi:putrescine aminotransferase